MLTGTNGRELFKQQYTFNLDADSCIEVGSAPEYTLPEDGVVNASLVLMCGDKIIAKNHYRDVLRIRTHIAGHPGRMSHEYGMRLYSY